MKSFMKKKWLSIALATIVSLSMGACGGETSGGVNSGSHSGGALESGSNGNGEKIYEGEEIFVSMRLAGFDRWLDDYAYLFEEETGCKVNINWNPSLNSEVRSIFMSSSYILDDLYFATVTDLWVDWSKEGKLLEIDGFDDILRDEMKTLGTYNDTRYTLDVICPPMGLVYNQDYLNAIPSHGEYEQGKFPETFQGLLDLCEKVNELGKINGKSVKPMSWGGKVEDVFDMYKALWAQGNGGIDYTNYVNQQGEEPVEEYFMSDSIKNALTALVSLMNVEDGYSANSILGCNEKDNINQEQNFLNGECVFCPSGSWFPTEMKDSITSDTFEFGFANMPLYDTSETVRTTLINMPTEQFFIPAEAENADIALAFLKFVFSAENCVDIHKKIGTPLAIKYEFTEEDMADLDSFSQQVTNTVFDNKIVTVGSNNPMFLLSVTCGRFVYSNGDYNYFFDEVTTKNFSSSDLDKMMSDSYLGFKKSWSEYRKSAGLIS